VDEEQEGGLMIAWLLTGPPGQIVALVFAGWFLNGLRKAVMKPRLTYASHQFVPHQGYFLTVKRQELLPPWRTLDETWFLDKPSPSKKTTACTRESDGWTLPNCSLDTVLIHLLLVKLARDAETERLVGER
jgi:hypothetical protein